MTYKEIAEKLNVSISTVSRALNGKPGISEELRSRILEAARLGGEGGKTGAPGSAGTHKKGKKAGKQYVAVVMRGKHNVFFSEIIAAMHDALRNQGYSMGIFRVEENSDEIETAVSLNQEDRLAGIVLLGGRYDYTPEEIKKIKVPFVMCAYTNRWGSLDSDMYSSVCCDDYMTAYNTVETLIKAGHRRIGGLFPSMSDKSVSELRFNGFCAALADNGIEYDPELVVETGSYYAEEAYQGMTELLKRSTGMTAIFTVSDVIAIGALKALWDKGISVPGKLSLISIDGLSYTKYSIPQLTTMVQPTEELGRQCIDRLMELIKGDKNRQIVLDTYLRPGGTMKKKKI